MTVHMKMRFKKGRHMYHSPPPDNATIQIIKSSEFKKVCNYIFSNIIILKYVFLKLFHIGLHLF